MRRTTRDHDLIRRWAEHRAGRPARVRGSEVLRIAFGVLPPNWEPISWERFFEAFDRGALSLWYDDSPDSRLCKLTRER